MSLRPVLAERTGRRIEIPVLSALGEMGHWPGALASSYNSHSNHRLTRATGGERSAGQRGQGHFEVDRGRDLVVL